MEYEYEELVKDLYMQTFECYPEDISSEDQMFVSELIYNNTMNIGKILNNQDYESLDVEDKNFIVQVVIEWCFHKSVDFIHSKIDHQFLNEILNNLSFIILKEIKQCIRLKIAQNDMLNLVENWVQRVYCEELEKLCKKNIIKKEEFEYAKSFSNIDDMAKESEQVSDVEEVVDDTNKKYNFMDRQWKVVIDVRFLLFTFAFLYTFNNLVNRYVHIASIYNANEIFSKYLLNAFGICLIVFLFIAIPSIVYYLDKKISK